MYVACRKKFRSVGVGVYGYQYRIACNFKYSNWCLMEWCSIWKLKFGFERSKLQFKHNLFLHIASEIKAQKESIDNRAFSVVFSNIYLNLRVPKPTLDGIYCQTGVGSSGFADRKISDCEFSDNPCFTCFYLFIMIQSIFYENSGHQRNIVHVPLVVIFNIRTYLTMVWGI